MGIRLTTIGLLLVVTAAWGKELDPCPGLLEQLSETGSLVAKLETSATKIAEWAHDTQTKVVVVSGRSGSGSADLFLTAWKKRYPRLPPPEVVHLGEIGNNLLYKHIHGKSDRAHYGQSVLEPYIGKDAGVIAEIADPVRTKAVAKFLQTHFPKAFEKKDAAILYIDSHSDTGIKAEDVRQAMAAQGFSDVRYAVYAGNPDTPEPADSRYLLPVRLTWSERSAYVPAAVGPSDSNVRVPFPLVYAPEK